MQQFSYKQLEDEVLRFAGGVIGRKDIEPEEIKKYP